MEEYEKTFENFWRDLVCKKDGNLDVDLVKRELHDYSMVMGEVSKVYMHITGGRISKPNTMAHEVIDEADRNYKEAFEDEDRH